MKNRIYKLMLLNKIYTKDIIKVISSFFIPKNSYIENIQDFKCIDCNEHLIPLDIYSDYAITEEDNKNFICPLCEKISIICSKCSNPPYDSCDDKHEYTFRDKINQRPHCPDTFKGFPTTNQIIGSYEIYVLKFVGFYGYFFNDKREFYKIKHRYVSNNKKKQKEMMIDLFGDEYEKPSSSIIIKPIDKIEKEVSVPYYVGDLNKYSTSNFVVGPDGGFPTEWRCYGCNQLFIFIDK